MTDDLLQAKCVTCPGFRDICTCRRKSGCDEILKRMKRMYTVALYDDMMQRIRETIPGVAVSSDFIVGFCGESEASFQKSIDLVERSRFKNSFIFKYSARTGTKADTLYVDDVPEEVKKRRNNDLLQVQNRICAEDNRGFVGRSVEVLVEGASRMTAGDAAVEGVMQLAGRTWCDRIVIFDGHERLIGQFLPVEIEETTAVTLFGKAVTHELAGMGLASA